jgi:hypothetical protein
MEEAIFNRFDIVEAWYLYCLGYHEGVNDWRYERLCRIRSYYSPTLLGIGLTFNGKRIYQNIIEKHER